MMYKLPKIPYTMDKDQSAEIPFRGINYSDRLSAGDLADSHGISLRRWPLVTNKRGREKAPAHICAHIAVHDGKFIEFYRGDEAGNFQFINVGDDYIGTWDGDGAKRFANVNSKTVVMPDKKYIEFGVAEGENPRFYELEATVEVTNPQFEPDKIYAEYQRAMDVFDGCFSSNEGSFRGQPMGYEEYPILQNVEFVNDDTSAYFKITAEQQKFFGFEEEKHCGISSKKQGIMTVKIQKIQADYSDDHMRTKYKIFVDCKKVKVIEESSVDIWWLSEVKFDDYIAVGDTIRIVGAQQNSFLTVKDVDSDTILFNESVEDESVYAGIIVRSAGEIFNAFKKGDTVTISGCGDDLDDNNKTFTIQKILGNTLYGTENVFVEGVEQGMVTITRKVPELNFICEAENRLWGCNNKENVIYISALGDPTNMYTYEGLTTDSFATAVGSPGDFTGCCRYGSSVLFFKEDKIHKILGTCPADYTLYSYDVEGIQKGSDRSPVVINEVLYYKGTHGIYAYDGGVPTLISECFGERIFYDAVAGTDGVSYFVSMRDERYVWYLFSYNTTTGIWTLEDKGFEARDAMRVGMELYFLDKEGHLWKENAVSDVSRSEWMMQFAPFYETMNGKKTYSRLLLRAEIPRGSYMVIEIRCDGGRWMELGKIVGKSDGVVPIRIPVNRCDKFEIKLSGKGEFVLRSMLREFYVSEEL